MIARIWHGFTSAADALKYETMLRNDVLPGIGKVNGYKGAQLLRRDVNEEVEFITITFFDNMEAVTAFAGEDYSKAVIHKEAGKLLTHYDERSVHYDLVDMVIPDFENVGTAK